MTKHTSVTCHECGTVKDIRAMYPVEIYWHPFDTVSETIYVCKNATAFKNDKRYSWMESCEELLTDTSWADFRFFTCEHCNRMICEQAPENGWHSQYRWIDESQVCLKCYEEEILENGIDRENFVNGKLPGMFFNSSDLAGWDLEIDDVCVRGKEDAKRICEKAIVLIDSGRKVVIDYERMAIGGLEGYVSLYSKEREEPAE